MKNLFFLLIALINFQNLKSQSIAAYVNFREQFVVFDDGQTKVLEQLPPQSFKVGPDYLAYIDNVSNLKVYYKGKVEIIDPGVILKYFAGDDYLVFEKYQQIKVWHKGKLTNLGNNITAYAASDSIVAFYDSNYKNFHIYYHETEFDLADGLVEIPITDFKIGNNIFAFIDKYQMTFTVFYENDYIDLSTVIRSVDYKLGADIVAYVDDEFNTFKAFFKGDIYDLESLPPKSFKMGNGMVAYVNQNEEFIVFYNGSKYRMLNFIPDSYDVKDSLVIFDMQGFSNIFYDGKTEQIERYIPKTWDWGWSTFAYLTENLRIKAVMEGVQMSIINETLREVKVYRNIIVIRYGNNSWAVHYKGKNYNLIDE
jgi:hypothetical protein